MYDMYDRYVPSPAAVGPTSPSPAHLAQMHQQVSNYTRVGRPDSGSARRWGLVGWALTVGVLLAVFGVLPELLSPEVVVDPRVETRTANP